MINVSVDRIFIMYIFSFYMNVDAIVDYCCSLATMAVSSLVSVP